MSGKKDAAEEAAANQATRPAMYAFGAIVVVCVAAAIVNGAAPDVFDAVGGWDEDFEFWFEDVDLARRLQEAGEILYVPTAVFPHVGGASAARLNHAEIVSRNYRGALLYARKHLGAGGRALTAPAYGLASIARLVTTRDAAARRAYAGVFRNAVRLAAGRPLLPP
jgi:GT2 family glycosyltransferase